MNTTIYDRSHCLSAQLREATVEFLFLHLGRFGDPREDIRKAIDHTQRANTPAGGFVCLITRDDTIAGAAVINSTGMESYIPENQLVYIAVHEQLRGQGIGRQLMEQVIGRAQGAIALHVEADNPARHLYQRLGFTNKYLEMRLERKEAR